MTRRILLALVLGALPAAAQAQAWAWDEGTVPYVQTPMEIVERMLRMAEVGKEDYVIDLGSGDGRIVIEAAKRGARAMGVDLDPDLVKLARDNARKAGVEEKARFVVKDIFETDLSAASVVTMYLLPEFNAKLLPRLLALKPGTRIVSHDGEIGDWPPDERLEMRIGQRFQVLDIEATAQGRELLVRASRLRGAQLKLAVSGVVGGRPWHHLFEGTIHAERISGELTVSDGEENKSYPWNATRTR